MTPQTQQTSDAMLAPFPAPASSKDEARALASNMTSVMNSLIAIVERETDLVRKGHITDAIELSDDKVELSRSYADMIKQLKESQPYLATNTPELLQGLNRHHDIFRKMLQANMTVLATAHAVSEGVIRGVNSEIQQRYSPQTYTAGGQHTKPSPRNLTPIVVNRTT